MLGDSTIKISTWFQNNMLKKKIAKEDIRKMLKVVMSEISSVADSPGGWIHQDGWISLSKNTATMLTELGRLENAEYLLAFYGVTFNRDGWFYSGLRIIF